MEGENLYSEPLSNTLVEKSLHTKASVWSKTRLNTSCVGGDMGGPSHL